MRILLLGWLALVCALAPVNAALSIEPPGVYPRGKFRQALVGGTVHVKPGQVVSNATVVLDGGRIVSVESGGPVPADARTHDYRGRIVYAGFVDPYMTGAELSKANDSKPGSNLETDASSLGSGVANFLGVGPSQPDATRVGSRDSQSNLRAQFRMVDRVLPGSEPRRAARELGFTAGNLVPNRGVFRGQSALITLGDAPDPVSVLLPTAWQCVSDEPDTGREGLYPSSLMGVMAMIRQTILDVRFRTATGNESQAGQPSPLFEPDLDALVPAVSRRQRLVFQAGSPLVLHQFSKLVREFGLDAVLVASGQEWRRMDLIKELGLPVIVSLAFPEVVKIQEEADWDEVTLDQLRAWDWAPENPFLLRKAGLEVALSAQGLGDPKKFWPNLQLSGKRGLSENDALAGLTVIPAKMLGVQHLLGTVETGKLANLTVIEGAGLMDPAVRVTGVWIHGEYYSQEPAAPKSVKPATPAVVSVDPRRERNARDPVEGRGPIGAAKPVLIRGATIWTSGKAGRISEADLLVVDGKIKAVGTKLDPQSLGVADPLVVDAAGKHVTPGLIDAHNHSMILGAVNEATLPSTAMVRVEDVINSESVHLRLQLAGGLTMANLLHGSANPIGGQSAIIKLRDGLTPDGLRFAGAPPGIKFALGENVKQSNWGDSKTNRFPQSRMGVRTFLQNRFLAARHYLELRRQSGAKPIRIDLELEALGEILEGKRWIHCHSYRQDEILMFLRLMEEFGVKIGTFQYVLEGYKVADELAAHGAGGSTFSDWWAFKFEVYDAIPFNGSLMRERGVLVSFNSDSSDQARRLNTEAAKAVKYGETGQEEALNFVTINPARQLRIDSRVGSLEEGKDADFAIWSGSPLSAASRCLQTWIDGRKYFDSETEVGRVRALEEERTSLLNKARRVVQDGKAVDPASAEGRKFLQRSMEHVFDGVDRHCLDEAGELGGHR